MTQRTNEYGQPIGDALDNWVTPPKPARVTLTGRYCTLIPYSAEAHASGLFKAYSQAPDGRDWTWMPVGPFMKEQDYIDYARLIEKSEDPLHYAIIDNATGQPVGSFALMRVTPASGSVEVGHVAYSPSLKGSRVATEAQYLLMEYVFDTLGYRRYEWKCDSLNAPSRRAAERLGFTFEGIFRWHGRL